MMRLTRFSFLSAPLLCLPLLRPAAPDDTPDPDRAAIERAALDYVEAFYEAKPELVERSVHKDLDKYGYWRRGPGQPYRGMAMDFDGLKQLAATLHKDQPAPADAPKKVEVLDQLDRIAVVKLYGSWGIDYMNLAKDDGKWKVRQVLWQSYPDPKSD